MGRVEVAAIEYAEGIFAFRWEIAEKLDKANLIVNLQFRARRHIGQNYALSL
jgi:hypothetical protein